MPVLKICFIAQTMPERLGAGPKRRKMPPFYFFSAGAREFRAAVPEPLISVESTIPIIRDVAHFG